MSGQLPNNTVNSGMLIIINSFIANVNCIQRHLKEQRVFLNEKHLIQQLILLGIHKDIFACLFNIHNTISLSCHEQVCLSGQSMFTCS